MSTILIADDHAITREPLARLLRYEGYETRCAANGFEAVEFVRVHGLPDLILLDLLMPKLNGLGVLQALHDDAARTGRAALGAVPIILMTGAVDSPDVAKARELGVTEVLLKAKFSVDELLRLVRTHLAPSAARTTAAEPSTTSA